MSSQLVFEKNLASFRDKNPALAELLATADLDNVIIGQGPRGAPTITENGMLLSSAYSPSQEGERMATEMNKNNPDLMIAIGFGLGHHLQAFRSTNKCPLIVFEPSLARLRAGLSIGDNTALCEKSDVYIVSDLGELQGIVSGLYTSGLVIGVFPLPAILRLSPETVRDVLDRVSQAKNSEDVTVNTRVQMLEKWAQITAGNGAYIRDTPSLSCLAQAFDGATAVVVCAGPSLTKQLPLLKKIRDRVLVISIGQAVGALREAGIEPDFVHVLESLPVVHQLEKGGSSSTLNLVVSPDVDESLFECPAASRFVMIPDSNNLARWLARALGDNLFHIGGGSVAHGAVSIAAGIGAKRIVLLGQDLAFTNGEAYASGSVYADTGIEQCADGKFRWQNIESKHAMFESLNWELKNPEQELLWVEGWDGDKVPTSKAYASFIDQYMSMAQILKQLGIELINCTEGGARIPKMRHQRFHEIEASLGRAKVDSKRVIQRVVRGWSAPAPDVFRGTIQSAHETIGSLEKETRLALREAERGYKVLEKKAPHDRELKILKRNRKLHKKVQDILEALPWLGDLIQPELQAAAPLLLRDRGKTSTGRHALQVSILQYKSARAGATRARPLLKRLSEALEQIDEPNQSAAE